MALVKCQDCGREVSDQAASCIGCGHPMAGPATLVTPPVAAQPSEPKPEPTGNSCTRCGSSTTQRVSLAYEMGTSSGWQAGVGVGASSGTGIIGGVTGGVGASSTELAKRLAPPSEPEAPEDLQGCESLAYWALVFLALFSIAIVIIKDGSYPEEAVWVAFLLCCLGFGLATRWSNKRHERKMAPAREQHQHQMARHAKAVELWRRQFICLSCNAIFEPKANTPSDRGFQAGWRPEYD